MSSPQYNPRRQHREASKKQHKRSGASPMRRDDARVQIPWWLWIIVGTAIGVFVSFLMRLSQTPPAATAAVELPKPAEKNAKPVADSKAAAKSTSVDDKSAKKGDDAAKPDETKTVTKFDFYTLLPEREVIVPNDRDTAKPAVDKPKNSGGQSNVAVADDEQLFLQAGSFRSSQEAERRRAQIKDLGLTAKVEEVIANADTWYRVQAGPFTSREQLSKARDQLSAAGIETLVLRQR